MVDIYRDTEQPRKKESYFEEEVKPLIFLEAVLAIIQNGALRNCSIN